MSCITSSLHAGSIELCADGRFFSRPDCFHQCDQTTGDMVMARAPGAPPGHLAAARSYDQVICERAIAALRLASVNGNTGHSHYSVSKQSTFAPKPSFQENSSRKRARADPFAAARKPGNAQGLGRMRKTGGAQDQETCPCIPDQLDPTALRHRGRKQALAAKSGAPGPVDELSGLWRHRLWRRAL